MVKKKSPSNVTLPTGDSLPPRHLVRAVVTWATAPTVVAAAAAGAAAPIPHASAAPPPLSKPRGDGKKTADDSAVSPPAKPRVAGKKSAEDAAGAPVAKPKGGAGKKSLRKTVPVEEETQPNKKKVCPMTFIS